MKKQKKKLKTIQNQIISYLETATKRRLKIKKLKNKFKTQILLKLIQTFKKRIN